MRQRGRVLKLLVLLLAFCLGSTVVFLIVARIFIGGVLQEPTTLEVVVEMPEQVLLNEPFVATMELTNIYTASQTLHSIDFEDAFLEHVGLINAQPAYQTSRSLPLTNFVSYEFDLELPPAMMQQPTVVEMTFVGHAEGEFYGVVDVCLEDGTLCVALPLETAVIER